MNRRGIRVLPFVLVAKDDVLGSSILSIAAYVLLQPNMRLGNVEASFRSQSREEENLSFEEGHLAYPDFTVVNSFNAIGVP